MHKYQEPPCPYSLTCNGPEEAGQALQFQEIDMLACKETIGKNVVHSKRTSCMLLGGSSPFQSRCFPLLGQIVQGEPVLPCRHNFRRPRGPFLTSPFISHSQAHNVFHFNLTASSAAAARTSCTWLGGFSPFQRRRTCSHFSSAKSHKASQTSRAMDAKQPPAPLGVASVA